MNTIIERTGGTLLIHTPTIPDPTMISTVRLAADGAIIDLTINTADPEMSIEVWDIDTASWWLPSVLGTTVTETALTLTDSLSTSIPARMQDTLTVDADPNAPLLPVLRRLALALWIRRWQPTQAQGMKYPLTPWLLDLEAGSLAVDASTVLDPDLCLAELLLAPHLTRLATEILNPLPATSAEAATVINTAAEDALDHVPATHHGWNALADAMRVRTQRDADITEAITDLEHMLEETAENIQHKNDYALIAGMGSPTADLKDDIPATVTVDGEAPADPRTVPARAIASGDAAIEWELSQPEDTVWRCDVTVYADDSNNKTTAELFATVDLDGYTDDSVLEPTTTGYKTTLWVHTNEKLEHTPTVRVNIYGGIPDSDVLPNRPDHDRLTDWNHITTITRTRQLGGTTEHHGQWDARFAAETEPRIPYSSTNRNRQ